MANEYGQSSKRYAGRPVSSVGEAVDLLLEMYTLHAYGVYGEDAHFEPVPVVDGIHMGQSKAQSPQHQLNTDGLKVVCPQFDAEKRATEKAIWKLLRRRIERMNNLMDGWCLKCHEKNDQPRHRYCSECEAKIGERVIDVFGTD